MKINEAYHIPVLLHESIDGLALQPNSVVVDVTFGGGGHSQYILSKLSNEGFLYAFDQDSDANTNIIPVSNFKLIGGNFKFLKNYLRAVGVRRVDAIIADIGVSSHQFNIADRGFSFRSAAPLDMRMNQKASLTAEKLLNQGSEEDLLRIFNSYSDLPNVFRLVQTLLAARQQQPIETTDQLAKLCEPLSQRHKDHKYIAQVFQALRIEVNDEIGALKKLLEDAVELLNPNGRIAVISYHSIEDRLVKNFFKKGNFEGKEVRDFYGNLVRPFSEITRHPLVPSQEEVLRNNRARSAKLRIAQKK